jgi:transposase InsO family protein
MKQHYPTVGLEKLCRLFGKSRQAFYDHRWRQSNEQLQEALVLDMVKSIRLSLPRIGGLKMHGMLRDDFIDHNIVIGRDRFFALLRKHDLLVKTKKRYIRTTSSNHCYKKWPDLIRELEINHCYKKWPDLIRELEINAPEQLWVSDLTYLRTENGFIYLSLITDAYSRKIVGYHLSQHLKAQGCLIALHKAIAALTSKNRSLIHHSDRGIQYCCEPYVSTLQINGIAISMTQTGSPYDNAIAERVNGILKTELDLGKVFCNYSSAVPAISNAINAYNQLRPHMSCGNITPAKAHSGTELLIKKWKSKKYCKAKSVLL